MRRRWWLAVMVVGSAAAATTAIGWVVVVAVAVSTVVAAVWLSPASGSRPPAPERRSATGMPADVLRIRAELELAETDAPGRDRVVRRAYERVTGSPSPHRRHSAEVVEEALSATFVEGAAPGGGLRPTATGRGSAIVTRRPMRRVGRD